MVKELNTLNGQIAPMREAIIRGEKSKEDKVQNVVTKSENVISNPNRTLFSPESLREHNVPGYGDKSEIEEGER